MNPAPLLSSRLTFLYKLILPGLSVAVLPFWVAAVLRAKSPGWWFMLGGLIIAAFFWWSARRLVRITVEEEHFLISSFLRAQRVPTTDLRGVIEQHFIKPPTIRLSFDPPTLFGATVKIMPPLPPGMAWERIDGKAASFLKEIAAQNLDRLDRSPA